MLYGSFIWIPRSRAESIMHLLARFSMTQARWWWGDHFRIFINILSKHLTTDLGSGEIFWLALAHDTTHLVSSWLGGVLTRKIWWTISPEFSEVNLWCNINHKHRNYDGYWCWTALGILAFQNIGSSSGLRRQLLILFKWGVCVICLIHAFVTCSVHVLVVCLFCASLCFLFRYVRIVCSVNICIVCSVHVLVVCFVHAVVVYLSMPLLLFSWMSLLIASYKFLFFVWYMCVWLVSCMSVLFLSCMSLLLVSCMCIHLQKRPVVHCGVLKPTCILKNPPSKRRILKKIAKETCGPLRMTRS